MGINSLLRRFQYVFLLLVVAAFVWHFQTSPSSSLSLSLSPRQTAAEVEDRTRRLVDCGVDVKDPTLSVQDRLKYCYAVCSKTTSPRCAPHFIILGTQKGGTSSLQAYIEAHPNVRANLHSSHNHEVHYYNTERYGDEDWYWKWFPTDVRQVLGIGQPWYISGEKTTMLVRPEVAERVQKTLPYAKLLVVLRDPVERAWSRFRSLQSRKEESKRQDASGFMRQCRAEIARIERCRRRWEAETRRNSTEYEYIFSCASRGSSDSHLMMRGLYALQLSHWWTYIPRSRFLVLTSPDLYTDTAATVAKVYEFLDLPPFQPAPETLKQVHWKTSLSLPLDGESESFLRQFFQQEDRKLFESLGRKVW